MHTKCPAKPHNILITIQNALPHITSHMSPHAPALCILHARPHTMYPITLAIMAKPYYTPWYLTTRQSVGSALSFEAPVNSGIGQMADCFVFCDQPEHKPAKWTSKKRETDTRRTRFLNLWSDVPNFRSVGGGGVYVQFLRPSCCTARALRAYCTQRPGCSPKNTCHMTGSTAKQQSPHENNETAFNFGTPLSL